MAPGENRLVGVSFRPPAGEVGELHAVYFDELLGDAPMNGFGLGVRLGTARDVYAHVVARYRSVFTRLAAGWGVDGARAEADFARKLTRVGEPRTLHRAVSERLSNIQGVLGHLARDSAVLDLRRQLRTTARVVGEAKTPDALVSLLALLERLDARLTMEQLGIGDPADISQTVRWQADVIRSSARLSKSAHAKRILATCDAFSAAYAGRGLHEADYPSLVADIVPSLEKLAERLGDEELGPLLVALRDSRDDLAHLQGAHRDVLLRLEQYR
jgi:hypothetical protein